MTITEFSAFWKWCSTGQSLSKGKRVKIDNGKLCISHGGKNSPYRISRNTAKKYTDLFASGKTCPSAFFRTVIKTYLSREGIQENEAGVKKDARESKSPNRAQDCVCLCCLSRRFLGELRKRHKNLQQPDAYPVQWIGWCIQGAQIKPYRTKSERQPIAKLLTTYLSRCAAEADYRSIWRDTIADLMRLGLSLGQAQKLVNLLSKYCFAYYFAEVNRQWMVSNPWVRVFANDFDVPIDQIVFRNIWKLYNKDDIAGGIYINSGSTGLVCRHVIPDVKLAWNRLECFGCYAEIQEFIREVSRSEGYVFPMEFEMDVLWP